MKTKKLLATMIMIGSLSLVACNKITTPDDKPIDTPTITATYTVTFINDNTNNKITVNENETIAKPSDPIKDGYSFIGWYNGNVLFDFNTKISSNITLTAKYQKNASPTTSYSVTFIKGNGEDNDIVSVNENETIAKPSDPIKDGYSFIGWYNGNVLFDFNTKISSNITLTAKYQKNASPTTSYSVTFIKGNGEDNDIVSVNENETIAKPSDPIKDGYSFIGWYNGNTLFDFNTKISSNITLTAKYQKIENLTVTFILNGISSTETIKYGEKISKPENPTKDNATFAGWYDENGELFDFNTNIKANITLTAKFNYTITYKLDNAIYKKDIVLENNIASMPSNPTKDGYSFSGWYIEGNDALFDFNNKITESYTLYAKWEKTNINVTAYAGYTEGAYFEITDANAKVSTYKFSYKKSDSSSYVEVDKELVRKNNNIIRCDILGLSEGSYTVKIINGSEEIEKQIAVSKDDRSGYAHFNNTAGVVAYNNDGTLKSNATIVYVTDENKNSVTATINGKSYTGLSNILQNQSKSTKPLCIRLLGQISAATWNQLYVNSYTTATTTTVKGANGSYLELKNYSEDDLITGGFNTLNTTTYSKLNGLTNKIKYDSSKKEFDSYYNMMDVSNAKNVTIEGVGSDSEIFQWGFTWKSCSSIEVKNITFTNSPEDACSFEGSSQTATKTDTSKDLSILTSSNFWLHNNTFNIGKNYWDVCSEQDKGDGDGSTDIKYVKNVTISYNKYVKTHKTGLVGGADNHLSANITFHHNYYENCKSRMPFARQANMHIYNNYYSNSTGTTMQIYAGAYAFLENNYFENDNHAFTVDARGYKATPAIKAYNNIFSNSKYTDGATIVTTREAEVKNGNLFNSSFDTDSSFFYYDSVNKKSKVDNMIETKNVPSYVPLHAGAGKLTKLYDTSDTPTTPQENTYTIIFDTNGGNKVKNQNVVEGNSITLPTPTKTGYTFIGWYTDSALTNKINTLDFTPTTNITLFAKWEESTTTGTWITFNEFSEGIISTSTTINGITIYPKSGKEAKIVSLKNTLLDSRVKNYVYLSGGGSNTELCVNFTISKQSNITVYYGNSTGRLVSLYKYNSEKRIGTSTTGTNGTTPVSHTFTNQEAGSYSIASSSSSIIIYAIYIE